MSYTREIRFGEATSPLHQQRMRSIVGKHPQDRWICLACRDKDFDLVVYETAQLPDVVGSVPMRNIPYCRLWSVLADLDCRDRKAWVIGWRLRYAFEKADFIGALERGEVTLPRVKHGKRKGKHTGKLTYNKRIFEVDIVCGRNKIKALDWLNFSVEPEAYAAGPSSIDADVVALALGDFLVMARNIDLDVCKSTAAQLGWYHARQCLSRGGLYVNLDGEARQLERRAYHGGRNEAYQLGEIPGTTYSLDVRSCYAWICLTKRLPFRMVEEYRAGILPERIDPHGADHWIADVVLRTDTPDYPLRFQGTPIYPIGEFMCSLPWPELRHALLAGRVQMVLRAARYEAAHVLKKYANWYLNARAATGAAYSVRVAGSLKATFNASLGYSAREKYDWVPWDCHLGNSYWLGTTTSPEDKETPVAAQVLDDERRWLRVAGEPFESVPYLHATICSYARVRLLEIFAAAGREEILYVDTDGILTTVKGLEKIRATPGMMADQPGHLVERFAPGRALIQGQKSYRVGANWIQAGVPKRRYSALREKQVLTVETGRADDAGRVHPFTMRRVKQKGERGSWQNEMA
jgi:hypothetical protein